MIIFLNNNLIIRYINIYCIDILCIVNTTNGVKLLMYRVSQKNNYTLCENDYIIDHEDVKHIIEIIHFKICNVSEDFSKVYNTSICGYFTITNECSPIINIPPTIKYKKLKCLLIVEGPDEVGQNGFITKIGYHTPYTEYI